MAAFRRMEEQDWHLIARLLTDAIDRRPTELSNKDLVRAMELRGALLYQFQTRQLLDDPAVDRVSL